MYVRFLKEKKLPKKTQVRLKYENLQFTELLQLYQIIQEKFAEIILYAVFL